MDRAFTVYLYDAPSLHFRLHLGLSTRMASKLKEYVSSRVKAGMAVTVEGLEANVGLSQKDWQSMIDNKKLSLSSKSSQLLQPIIASTKPTLTQQPSNKMSHMPLSTKVKEEQDSVVTNLSSVPMSLDHQSSLYELKELGEMRNQFDRVLAELGAKEKELAMLQGQLEFERGSSKNFIDHLQQELHNLQQSLSNREAELANAKVKMEHLEKQRESLLQQLSRSREADPGAECHSCAPKLADLAATSTYLNGVVEQRDKELDMLKRELMTKDEYHNGLLQQIYNIQYSHQKLQEDSDKKDAEVKKCKETEAQLRKETAYVQQTLQETKSSYDQLVENYNSKATLAKEQLQHMATKLQETTETAKQKDSQISSLSNQVNDLKKNLKETGQKVNEALQDLKVERKVASNYRKETEEIFEQMSAEYKQLEDELTIYQQQPKSKPEAALEKMRAQQKEVSRHVEALKKEIKVLKENNSELLQQNSQLAELQCEYDGFHLENGLKTSTPLKILKRPPASSLQYSTIQPQETGTYMRGDPGQSGVPVDTSHHQNGSSQIGTKTGGGDDPSSGDDSEEDGKKKKGSDGRKNGAKHGEDKDKSRKHDKKSRDGRKDNDSNRRRSKKDKDRDDEDEDTDSQDERKKKKKSKKRRDDSESDEIESSDDDKKKRLRKSRRGRRSRKDDSESSSQSLSESSDDDDDDDHKCRGRRKRSQSPQMPKIDKFTGDPKDSKGNDWEGFIFTFERLAKRRGWPETKKRHKLIECLGGKALRYAKKLGIYKNYKELKEKLGKRFDPRESCLSSRKKLNYITQGDKSEEDFHQECHFLALDGFPNADEKTIDEIAIEAFTHGLNDKKAAEKALDKRPRDYHHCLELVKEAIDTHNALYSNQRRNVRTTHFDDQPGEEMCINNNAMIHPSVPSPAKQWQLEEKLRKLEEKVNGKPLPVRSRSPSPNRACWECGEVGHFKDKCPQKGNKDGTVSPTTQAGNF